MPLPQKRLIPGILLMLVIAALAAPPLWWGTGNPPVIDPAAAVNNKGPANIGQAKHMAKSALDALRPVLPAVADEIEADLAPIVVFTVPDPKTPDWIKKQKAPLLIGQLKAIADPFYTRLHAAAPTWLEAERVLNGTHHPGSIFPWTTVTTDDANKAIANIGQLKSVFSLRFNSVLPEEEMPRLAVNGALSVMVADGQGNPLDAIPLLFQRISGDGHFPGGASVTTRSTDPAGIVSIADYTSPEGDVIQVTMHTPYGDQRVWLPANISTASHIERTGSGGLVYYAPTDGDDAPSSWEQPPDPEPDPIVYNIDNYVRYSSFLNGTEDGEQFSGFESYSTFNLIVPKQNREGLTILDENGDPIMVVRAFPSFFPERFENEARLYYLGNPVASRFLGFTGESFTNNGVGYSLSLDSLAIDVFVDTPSGYTGIEAQYGSVNVVHNLQNSQKTCLIDGTKDVLLTAEEQRVNATIVPAPDMHEVHTGIIFGPFISSEDPEDPRYVPIDHDDNPNTPLLHRFDTILTWDDLKNGKIGIDDYIPTILNVSFLRGYKHPKAPSGSRGESMIGEGLFVRVVSSSDAVGVRMDADPQGTFDPGGQPFYAQTAEYDLTTMSEMTDLGIKCLDPEVNIFANVNISLRHRLNPNEVIVEKTLDVVKKARTDNLDIRNHSANRDESSGPRYRKIALNGLPLSDEKPQSEDETDEEKEESYVDALTRELRHSTTDIYIPVPSSELALTVRRNANSEIWSAKTDLYPGEEPTLAFGPAWRSNLTANVRIVEQKSFNGELVASIGMEARKEGGMSQSDPNYAYVTDEDGSTHRFIIAYTWPTNPDPLDLEPTQPLTRTYLPAPNSRNESEAYEMTLSGSPEEGFVFTKKHGNVLNFGPQCIGFTISGKRSQVNAILPLGFGLLPDEHDLTPPGGGGEAGGGVAGVLPATGVAGGGQVQAYSYHRLQSVSDRLGNRINYTYDGAQDLVPSEMSVEGRPEISLKIVSNAYGRVEAVYDAKGNGKTFTYDPPLRGSLKEVHAGGDRVAQYGYKLWEEEDYRQGVLDGSGASSVPWSINQHDPNGGYVQVEDKIQHYDIEAITDADDNTVTFRYEPDTSHMVTVVTAGVSQVGLGLQASAPSEFTYPLSGYPPDVTEIILPDGANVLIGGGGGIPVQEGEPGAETQMRHTTVQDAAGNRRTYRWPTFVDVVLDQDNLGYAGAENTSGFPGLGAAAAQSGSTAKGNGTTSIFTYYTSMEIEYEAGGKERYEFNTVAGSALSKITDADGNVTLYGQGTDLLGNPIPPLPVPEQNGGIFPLHNPEPTSQTDALGRVKRFAYGDFGIMETEIAASGNRTEYGVDTLGRRTSVKVYDSADTLLSETEFDYHSDTPGSGFPGFMTRRTVKNTGAFSGDDPEWVESLTTLYELDSNEPDSGRVHREATDMNANNAIDAGDLITTYSYDRNGNKLSATDPADLTTWFHYDARHRITGVTYPDGTSTETIYDARGNKVLTRDERRIASGHVYDVRGRLTQTVRDMNGNLAWNAATQEFTGIDPGTDIISGVTYNGVNSPVTSTDPRGYVAKTEYDHLQRPIRIYTPGPTRDPGEVPDDAETDQLTQLFYDGGNSGGGFFNTSGYKPTKSIDPRGYITLAAYDALYRPVSTRSQYSLDPPLFAATSQVYDPVSGMVTDAYKHRDPVDADGNAVGTGGNAPLRIHTEYDALFRPAVIKEGFGTAIEVQSSSFYTSTGLTHRTSRQLTATEYAISDMEYDAAGRPVKSIGPEIPLDGTATMVRPETSTAYDRSGNIWQTTDPRGNVTTLVHDARNRLVQTISPEIPFGTEPLLGHAFTTTEYDPAGNPVKITDPRGNVTETKFDAANRAYEVTAPAFEDAETGLAVIPVTSSVFDLGGNVLQVTDPNGNVTLNSYDPLSRLVQTKTNPTVVASAASHADDILVAFEYDKANNRTLVTDGEGQVTGFEFDGANRLTKTLWDKGDAREKTQTTEYDAALTLAAVDGRGIRTEFQYDARFRNTSSTCAAIPDDDQFRDYDLAGRLLSANRATAGDKRNVSYTYDALGRTTSETSAGFTHLYGHDRAGNLTRVHYQETGRRLASAFDPLNRLSTVTETLDGSAGERVTGYAYDLSGNLLLKTLPNGTAEAGGYDALNRRTTRATTRGGVTVSAFDYGHDAAGNVTVIREARGSTAVPDRFIRNTYDRAYRLLEEETSSLDATGAVAESTVVSYTYDRADNRATKSTAVNGGSAATISYTYGSAANGLNSNQLATFTEGGDTTSFTYDANGNRLTRAVNATLSDSYGWDSANRLVSLEKGTATYLYGYDHRSRRVIRDESDANGEETLVSFSGGSGVFEKENSAVTVEFIRGSDMGGGVGGILYSVRGGAASFSAYDGRGDVVAKTNAAGTVEWEASYEAFGTRTAENGQNEDRHRANTKEEDPTGLLNEGQRYRDNQTGAFISRDPLGFVDGPNVYTYVTQNPWTMFDPLGLKSYKGSDASDEDWEKLNDKAKDTLKDYRNKGGTGQMLADAGFDMNGGDDNPITQSSRTIKSKALGEVEVIMWQQGDKTLFTREVWGASSEGGVVEGVAIQGWDTAKEAHDDLASDKFWRGKGGEAFQRGISAAAGFSGGLGKPTVNPVGPPPVPSSIQNFKLPVQDIVKQINLKGRITESGMKTTEAGKFFGWGSKEITKHPDQFTKAGLEAAGWTRERLLNVADGYRKLYEVTPNKSAPLRAAQLEKLAEKF